jgi:hypothetical protein
MFALVLSAHNFDDNVLDLQLYADKKIVVFSVYIPDINTFASFSKLQVKDGNCAQHMILFAINASDFEERFCSVCVMISDLL